MRSFLAEWNRAPMTSTMGSPLMNRAFARESFTSANPNDHLDFHWLVRRQVARPYRGPRMPSSIS